MSEDTSLPEAVRRVLSDFASSNYGVYDPPYQHQIEALRAFFGEDLDLIVTTGTGSGKTEIFTSAILGNSAIEGSIDGEGRPDGAPPSSLDGIRTLVLYPMNALVSDQLTRIRKMFGTREVEGQQTASELLQNYRPFSNRPFRFAMYTSRTPYHGIFNEDRNASSVRPIINFFRASEGLPIENDLQDLGRMPQKDLVGFVEHSRRINRFRTQSTDAEYLTRQEMLDATNRAGHGGTPDLLITNYSMLEYMLLRPIEQPLLDDTRNWLEKNPDQKILIIMDESFTFTGAQEEQK